MEKPFVGLVFAVMKILQRTVYRWCSYIIANTSDIINDTVVITCQRQLRHVIHFLASVCNVFCINDFVKSSLCLVIIPFLCGLYNWSFNTGLSLFMGRNS